MAGGGSDLSKRLRAALLILGLLAGALLADLYLFRRDVGLLLLSVLTLALAYNEFADLCASRGTRTFRVFGIVGCCALLVLQWLTLPSWRFTPGGAGLPLLWDSYEKGRAVVDGAVVVLILVVFLRQAFVRDSSDALPAVGMTLLGVLYLWLLPSYIYRIRHLGGREWLSVGNGLFLSTVILCKIADVGAYFVGRKFGRHKLIPRISPAKSVEGAVAGLACSAGAGLALWWIGLLPAVNQDGARAFGPTLAVAFGLLVGGTGMCGDLFESILKRSGGAKDSGRVLPGYGGVLDVVDSVIISAPPAYLFLRAVAGFTMS